MINREDRHYVHEFIVLDLAIRSLQKDFAALETLKMKKFYLSIVEQLLKDLRHEYYNRKRVLSRKGIRIVRWVKLDEYFSDVIMATAGEDIALRYANQALKTEVEQLLIQKATSV